MTPVLALIVYRGNAHYPSDSDEIYVEMRDINKKGKMGAAAPLSRECIGDLITSLKDEGEFSVNYTYGKIPENLLYFDTNPATAKLIWYDKPGLKNMYFTENIGIEDGLYYMPGVIYQLTQEKLDIYAYKGKTPKMHTRLYKAPFFNVTRTSVCLGNSKAAELTDRTFSNVMKYWESLFWNSRFSSVGSQPTKSNLVVVTKKAKTKFDTKELLPFYKDHNQKQPLLLKDICL
ncbi:MAG: prokaryotic E2 ligase family D protein [Clostridium sp.]|nr:prokaryotic E2 ligase family D protein [Clostridium sp.]